MGSNRIVCVLLLALAAFLSRDGSVAAAQEGVSGAWDLVVESSDGTSKPSAVFRQDGERLTGTYRGRMGEAPLEGSIRGASISFSVSLRFQDQTISVVYSGTVDGDEMKGTVRFGDAGNGRWTGRRRARS